MKTVVIKEYSGYVIPCDYELNLSKETIKDCVGCWSCWWKTPGRCAFHDIDAFYKEYLSADKVIIFSKVTKNFVSGNLKTLFDRMIPHFLPYTKMSTGESRHIPRYDKYPDIELYYQGKFSTIDDKKIYEDYIRRTFDMFESNQVVVKPVEEFQEKEHTLI